MFKTIHPTGLFIAALLSAGSVTALADEHAHPAPATQAQTQPATQPSNEEASTIGYTPAAYPLTTCVVSGEKLDVMGEPYVIEVDGREVQLCCKGCEDKVRADPTSYLEKIDQAAINQQMGSYPLTTCLIDKSEALGDDAVNLVWENRLVRFCCPSCAGDFKADPATHIRTLNQAVIDKQKASYPVDYCVVSGEKLASMDQPVDHVVGHRLVQLCCEGCVKDLSANPAKYLSILDGAQSSPADKTEGSAQNHHEENDANDHHDEGHGSHESPAGHGHHDGH